MNESPPPLAQWLFFRDPGIGKPALILKFEVTVWPSDPCQNRDGVDRSAKRMFRLPERLFSDAQSFVEIPQLPCRLIENSTEVREFVFPDHRDLMSEFALGQRF